MRSFTTFYLKCAITKDTENTVLTHILYYTAKRNRYVSLTPWTLWHLISLVGSNKIQGKKKVDEWALCPKVSTTLELALVR